VKNMLKHAYVCMIAFCNDFLDAPEASLRAPPTIVSDMVKVRRCKRTHVSTYFSQKKTASYRRFRGVVQVFVRAIWGKNGLVVDLATRYCSLSDSGRSGHEQPTVRTTSDWSRGLIRPDGWLSCICSAQLFLSGSVKVGETAIHCAGWFAPKGSLSQRRPMRTPRGPWRSGAYRVFTRKRAILVRSSVKSLRTRLDGAGTGDFAHNNLRSGRARRPALQLYTIRTVSRR